MSDLNTTNAGVTDNFVGGTYTTPNNPVNTASRQTDSAPYEGTGVSTHGNNVESTTSGTAGEDGVKHGGGVKGIAAAVHGAGEKIRGKLNKGVDDSAHDDVGSAKNDSIAREGDSEISSGNFSTSAKKQEGALPGTDYEQMHKHGQMDDLNRE